MTCVNVATSDDAMERHSVRDLFLGFEQLEVIRDLLLSGSPVRARMALILLDGLADAMLFRRLEDLYDASEMPVARKLWKMPHYTRKTRLRARQYFSRRVELARQRVPSLFGNEAEWLSDDDATVLRVCHSYRNVAYHEDSHNPNVISSIARMQFGVVARLLAHMQPSGVMRSLPSETRVQQLAEWGYEPGTWLNDREAADAVANHLSGAVALDTSLLSVTFADDLEDRADALREDVRFLSENAVDEPERLIEGAELATFYSADEELLELQDQFDPYWLGGDQSESGGVSQESMDRVFAAVNRHYERMNELERQHTRRVTLRLIDEATETAERLRSMTEPTRMLVTYREVDFPLSELESYVGQVVEAVDREIERQDDIRRGK